jgi:hypothetical protein
MPTGPARPGGPGDAVLVGRGELPLDPVNGTVVRATPHYAAARSMLAQAIPSGPSGPQTAPAEGSWHPR